MKICEDDSVYCMSRAHVYVSVWNMYSLGKQIFLWDNMDCINLITCVQMQERVLQGSSKYYKTEMNLGRQSRKIRILNCRPQLLLRHAQRTGPQEVCFLKLKAQHHYKKKVGGKQ